jgi:spermidine synthase
MHRRLFSAFLLMGISFTTLQALMARELLVSFSGNELSIGFVLGAWLVLEALGSGLAGHFADRFPSRPAGYAWLQVLLALLLPPSLLVAMHVRRIAGTVPGEAIAPLPVFLASLLVLAPLGLVDGAMFTTACRVWVRSEEERRTIPAGRVYVLEAAGGIIGGIALTYALLPWMNSTQILLLIAALNLASALSLFLVPPRRPVWMILLSGLLGAAAVVGVISPLGTGLHQWAVSGRWAPYNLVYEANSSYGNVAVIEEYGQLTVFANGTPLLTAPDPDVSAVEHLSLLPSLFLDEPPAQVLIIGGGAGGVLHEWLELARSYVQYVELDPLLLQALQEVPTPLTMEELSDPNLRLHLQDGRRYVRERVETCASGSPCTPFDVVLINFPYPSTLELNRLYTQEFFEIVPELPLHSKGLLVLPTPPARTYMSPVARDLLASYARTLSSIFPHVRAIPADDMTLWLASEENALDQDVEELVRRLEERGLEGRVMRPDYVRYLLDGSVVAQFATNLDQGPAVEINHDARPAGLRYALAYESALLSPGLEPFFSALGRLRWTHVALGIAGLTLAGWLLLRRRRSLIPTAIATTGLAGMVADLLIIFAFQVLLGYVYQQIALLITAFMAGLSVGGLFMTGRARGLCHPWRTLTLLEGGVTLGMVGVTGLLFWMLQGSFIAPALQHGLLLLANAVMGVLVGLEFPLANHILLQEGREGSRVAGALYAYDLLGATVGAVALSAVLLPALGLVETALLVVLLKAGSLLLVGVAPVRWR